MKIRPEQIDSRIAQCVEAWRAARQHASTIADQGVRAVAEKIADGLRDESIREVLTPLFKAAVKGKAVKNGKKAQKEDKKSKKEAKKAKQADTATSQTIA